MERALYRRPSSSCRCASAAEQLVLNRLDAWAMRATDGPYAARGRMERAVDRPPQGGLIRSGARPPQRTQSPRSSRAIQLRWSSVKRAGKRSSMDRTRCFRIDDCSAPTALAAPGTKSAAGAVDWRVYEYYRGRLAKGMMEAISRVSEIRRSYSSQPVLGWW